MDTTAIPIVLVASGTATAASQTYQRMDAAFRRHFPDNEICWAYSSRAIRRRIQAQGGRDLATPASVLADLYQRGYRQVAIQSLHLICGQEFHQMVWEAAQSPLSIKIGLPLLAHPDDFDALLDWMAGRLPENARDALVMVGHGTAHPSWMTYEVLARRLGDRFGHQVCLGLISKGSGPDQVVRIIQKGGFRRVVLRPFMLVAGAHFSRDIAGDRPGSWKTELESAGFTVFPEAQGLGADPAIQRIFVRHIRAALKSDPLILS